MEKKAENMYALIWQEAESKWLQQRICFCGLKMHIQTTDFFRSIKTQNSKFKFWKTVLFGLYNEKQQESKNHKNQLTKANPGSSPLLRAASISGSPEWLRAQS